MRKQTHLFAALAIVLAASPALAQTAEVAGMASTTTATASRTRAAILG